MSNVYTVSIDGTRTVAHVLAKSKAAAKKAALANITVTKLSAGEALALSQAGIAIINADTGTVANAPGPAASDAPDFVV